MVFSIVSGKIWTDRRARRSDENGDSQNRHIDSRIAIGDSQFSDMNFLQSLAKHFAGKPIDWDELEEALIRADLGVPMTLRIIKTLQEREAWALLGIGDVMKAVSEEIARILPRDRAPIRRATCKPTAILIVGVNGTGKTTSTAKLAHYLSGRGGSPEPPAGDRRQSPLPRSRQ